MTTLALINVVLYGVVAYRAARYFLPCGDACRDEDKAVVAAVGTLALALALGQVIIMAVMPGWGRSVTPFITLLWAMSISNGVVYLVVINFLSSRSTCKKRPRRYFP